jgi:hypothetical protein
MGARRTGAAARGAADLRLSCGSTLGCVVYQQAGARLPRTPTRSSALVTRGVARGVAAASTTPAPKQSTPTGSQGKHTTTASTRTWKVQALRAAAVRPQAHQAFLRPSPECAGAWPQACLRTRGLAVPARRSTLVARGAARSEVATHATVPAQENMVRRPDPYTFLARRQRRPRARTAQEPPPSRYGSPAARRPATRQETIATRLVVANPTQEGDQGGEERRGVAVLTVGRRCSRGRPVGGVASVFRA